MRFTLVFLTVAKLIGAALAQNQDLTELLESERNLTEFTKLLTSYGDIYANLSFQQDVTILAPNNDAFNKIPYSSLNSAFQNNESDIIRAVLQYHVLQTQRPSESFNGTFSFTPTWLYNRTYTNVTGGQVVGGVSQAGNVNVFTSGLGSRSTMDEKNLEFANGIVHTIDTFLVPPANFIATCPQFNLTAAGGAAAKASLDTYLNTQRDLTIFAPSNDAFTRLGSTLSKMSVAQLADILNYHVVNSSSFVGYSSNLVNGTTLRTRQGASLTITVASNSLFVNSARVVQQDILLSNGVMHVIDNLLDYNTTAVRPEPELTLQPAVLQGSALTGYDVPFATYLPTGVSAFPTTTGTASFGADNIGGGTSGLAATATSTRIAKPKSAAGRTQARRGGAGVLLAVAAVAWMSGAW